MDVVSSPWKRLDRRQWPESTVCLECMVWQAQSNAAVSHSTRQSCACEHKRAVLRLAPCTFLVLRHAVCTLLFAPCAVHIACTLPGSPNTAFENRPIPKQFETSGRSQAWGANRHSRTQACTKPIRSAVGTHFTDDTTSLSLSEFVLHPIYQVICL